MSHSLEHIKRWGSCLAFAGALGQGPVHANDGIAFFEEHIRPILVSSCGECHSSTAKKIKAGLYLDSRETTLQGGDSGPAIIPGDPNNSLLMRAIRYKEESMEMPPKGRLSDQTIARFETWISIGAPWPEITRKTTASREPNIDMATSRREHWAFAPIRKPSPPLIENTHALSNPIDQFIQAKLVKNKMTMSPQAKPRILIRRAYFDLLGLPPAPASVMAFQNGDHSWYDIIDRLLSAPQYGERWSRHWLDVARYSDGYGGFLDSGALPQAWRYRDWVIHALNRDLPYDIFIQQQIAADLLPNAKRQDFAATGFFTVGPTYRSDGGDPEATAQAKAETLSDRVDTLSRAFLGLTVACARCHDHKFDAITQADYYSLAGIFNNTSIQESPLVSDKEVKRYHAYQQSLKALNKTIQQIRKQLKEKPDEAEALLLEKKTRELDKLKANPIPKYPYLHALRDSGSEDMHLAIRGDLRKKGPKIPRSFLEIIEDSKPPYTSGSGRAELADSITALSNPLTARVMVNRVWQWHFGHALARSPSNFGVMGTPPTHPELLDWLAVYFMESGWSLKALHRVIMQSSAYRMSSRHQQDFFLRDGDNKLLWRMNPRQMEVEVWRDTLLAVTGELSPLMGGRPEEAILEHPRRTVYATISRNGDRFASDAFLRLFGFPDPRQTSPGRQSSVVASQSLFLLNSTFIHARAVALASIMRGHGSSQREQIQFAYQRLYQRAASPDECQQGIRFMQSF
ncbi:MAG: PSD1 and planctomycete cytochrome C domain-containing protein, partial [Verrucomicrobiota bacterium]|nr:PSD1 and planctomycete cytochrome C domain-containing protein [Verrucomicrobiota bacterium]